VGDADKLLAFEMKVDRAEFESTLESLPSTIDLSAYVDLRDDGHQVSEVLYLQHVKAEQGIAWETETFGAALQPLGARIDCAHGLMIVRSADLNPDAAFLDFDAGNVSGYVSPRR
jgi:hypothetical protein